MARKSQFQRYEDNILIGSTPVSTPSPSTTYAEATLLTHRPSARVLWGSGTVAIVFTLTGSMRGDTLVIPVWNVDAGSAVAVLTNAAGLSKTITVPTMRPSGIPLPTVLDLVVAEPNATTRTSATWTLTVTSNSAHLIMGGAIAIYGPQRSLTSNDFTWEYSGSQQGYAASSENDYGTDYIATRRTLGRRYRCDGTFTDADRDLLDGWADANFIQGLPGFLWLNPDDRNVPVFGRLDGPLETRALNSNITAVGFNFREIGKGKPVA